MFKRYRVKRPLHFLSEVDRSRPIPSFIKTYCGGRYEVLTNKTRFYEGTKINYIRG